MLAKDVMNPNVITVREDTPVKEIARIMLEKDISGLPVVDRNENVVGVVSELDLMRKQIAPDAPSIWTTLWGKNNDGMQKYVDDLRKYMGKTAEEVMTAPALTVDVNIKGAVNVLEALRSLEKKPRLLLVGSSEEYGAVNEAD